MKLKGYLWSAFLVAFISIIGFSYIAILISNHKIIQFDQRVITFVQGLESPFLTLIMRFFTYLGSFPSVMVLFIVISYYLYIVLKHRAEFLLFGTVVVGTIIFNEMLKHFFHRARPDFHRLIEAGGYSFPSGHAMSAFAFYGIVAFLLWRHIPDQLGRTILILVSILFIFIIGISRIYLGVHYPSDIVGGYFASALWLTIAIWFFQRYKEKQYERSYRS
ncbi:phosphatase PAP2 family protein [Rummeliibacillus pycnus]|uniref:phosphatase PAP2 family protein n=1 Tax=Rummeliibacillus pycnus TaxID=101070 RepID=UPI000C9CDAA4|nr:phosphatase PAP2 family protein [Rummeliibacillus pycnus]